MLGSFQTTCNSSSSLTNLSHNFLSFSLLYPIKPRKTIFPFSLSLFSNALSNATPIQGRNGVSVFAVKKGGKGEKKNLLEMGGFEEDGDDNEDGEDEDEDVIIPLANMKAWMENKPAGFGEKKVYDTSVEDKLMEEIEQSRTAQLANINKLKHNPISPNSKKEQKVLKAPEVVPSGSRVRVGNLPKKKNVHRDLHIVFKEFHGILNIIPAVSGSKKTRDPICKGFAFVDLGSQEVANRFVQAYSKQSITFGKIQKEITCEIADPNHPSNSLQGTRISTPSLRLPRMKEDPDEDFVDIDTLSLVTSLNKAVTSDDDSIPATLVEIAEEGIQHLIISKQDEDEIVKPKLGNKSVTLPSKQQQKNPNVKKKRIVKGKSEKVPKLNILGSSKRLRTTEKALLTDTFAKYGVK